MTLQYQIFDGIVPMMIIISNICPLSIESGFNFDKIPTRPSFHPEGWFSYTHFHKEAKTWRNRLK